MLIVIVELGLFTIGQKLREEWIARQKIKNAYKAQKRRGTLDIHPVPDFPPDDVDNDALRNDSEDEADRALSSELKPGKPSESEPRESFPSTSRTHTRPPKSVSSPSPYMKPSNDTNGSSFSSTPAHQNAKRDRKGKSRAEPMTYPDTAVNQKALEEKERIRSLFKDAYSPSSLHTHKSDPLRKRRNESNHHGNTSGRGRGGTRGRGSGITRGQPDMRKRMGALLAQIESKTGS